MTDFFQFILAMIGTFWAAYVIVNLPEIGGLESLIAHENVIPKLDIIPDINNTEVFITLLVIPLAVQWWASYYPGAEPGGGGYIAQRMLAAKDEKNAVTATLLFNIMHYALRPWPWILIALASLVVFPDLTSIQTAFPHIDPSVVDDDLAYSAMLTFLPNGLLGLVVASLIAAFMSTISTHLNWGSSYVVNDFYKRFVKPEASDKELVMIGRISTLALMVCAAIVALFLQNAKEAFGLIVLMGAGTGLLFILRWFWWRINAYSELSAMIISFLVAVFFKFVQPGLLEGHWELLASVAITTLGWIGVTYLTSPVKKETLVHFYQLIKPHSMGWQPVIEEGLNDKSLSKKDISIGKLPAELLNMFAGIFFVYGILLSTGYCLYANYTNMFIGLVVTVLSGLILWRNWVK